MSEKIKIKKRGDDGFRVISVRIRENTLTQIDVLSANSNYSRNELINILLENAIKNVEIEE